MELKKASNHPYLFEGAETKSETKEEILRGIVMNSGKMVLLDKLLSRLQQDGHRVLVFSQMVRMLCVPSSYSIYQFGQSLISQFRSHLQRHPLRLLSNAQLSSSTSRWYRSL